MVGLEADLSIHMYRTYEMCGMLILKNNDHEEAMSIACTILRGFCRSLPGETNISRLNEPQIAEAMQTRYQCAEASLADRHRILTIQKDVKAAKQYLQETVGSFLERGEAIENLVAKSDNLSQKSKEFYVTVGGHALWTW
jgi:synaptobrevin family protein YKT6